MAQARLGLAAERREPPYSARRAPFLPPAFSAAHSTRLPKLLKRRKRYTFIRQLRHLRHLRHTRQVFRRILRFRCFLGASTRSQRDAPDDVQTTSFVHQGRKSCEVPAVGS